MGGIEIQESKFSKFLFADVRLGLLWLVIRLYLGYEWLVAGWHKLGNPMWLGENAGTAIKDFLSQALIKHSGEISLWYSYFIENIVLKHPVIFSYLVVYGEILVGVALILGLFTAIASSFGMFMNLNYILAGAISTNPIMIVLEIILLLAWRTSGWIGLDRFILPSFGVTWQSEPLLDRTNRPSFRNIK